MMYDELQTLFGHGIIFLFSITFFKNLLNMFHHYFQEMVIPNFLDILLKLYFGVSFMLSQKLQNN